MILHSCPKCARQYDVTHLAPKSKVRCVCDEAFEVTWRKPFVVAHLQCAHCAGPVERDDVDCRYCGKVLPEAGRRARSLCPECFARIDEDSRHCRACGIAIRPQAIAPIPHGRDCPRCAGELTIRMLEHDTVIECARCGGAWFEARTFERVCAEARRRASGTPVTSGPPRGALAVQEAVSYIACLACGEIMMRKQYRQEDRASGVIVDYCKDHGIWLDADELERIVDFLHKLEVRGASNAGSSLGLGAKRQLPASIRTSERKRRPSGPVARLTEVLDFLGSVFFDSLV